MGADWRRLGTVDPPALREARLQAHYAVQWLARAARAYVPAKPDDSHTSLGWDEGRDGLTTHLLPGGIRLALAVSTLTLALVEAGTVRSSLALPGRTDRDARAWLGGEMQALQCDPQALDAPSPWDMPAHPIANGAPYDVSLADARAELAAWFANADHALNQVRSDTAARDKPIMATPVRCWPHHFDIATLMALEGGDPEYARSVNAGLSPGDGSYDEPYFYVSPWPYPDAGKLTPLPAPGHWHTQGFLAAVAPARAILATGSPQPAADAFLKAAVAAAIAALG